MMIVIKGYLDKSQNLQVPIENIYLTSDTHFGHKNIIKYSNRPYKDVHHMNQELVKNWNSVVGEEDVVFHLGDFGNTMSAKDMIHILNFLNGKIFLIKGNHEKSVLKKQYTRDRFEWIRDKYELEFGKEKSDLLVMCHYAHRVWNKSHFGSLHVYGHSHGSMEHTPWGKSMDVGVDCNDYKPIALTKVIKILQSRDTKIIDKHKEKDNV
jgi:calcineurin-like phosphoesterase family protein